MFFIHAGSLVVGLHYHSGLREFIFHPASLSATGSEQQPSTLHSGLPPGRAAPLSIADRGKPEKPPPCQKGAMTPNHYFPYNLFFTLEHSSLAPHTGTSSPPYQESGRGRKNNCTEVPRRVNENSPKLVRYEVTHERKKRVRKVLFALHDTLSPDYVLSHFSQC